MSWRKSTTISEPLPPPWRPPRIAPLGPTTKLAWRLIIFSSRRGRFRGDKLFSLPPDRSFKNAGKLSSVKHLSETPYIYILRARAAETEGEVVLQRKAGLEYWLGSEALLWSVFFCVFVHCLETVWLFWPVRYFIFVPVALDKADAVDSGESELAGAV